MSKQDRSSAARTPKDVAWSAILRRQSELQIENATGPSAGKGRTREQIFADWLATPEGARMYAAWRNAGSTPIEKLKDALPIVGPMKKIIDVMIVDGGKEIRKRDPSLSEAEAVSRFLKTADGKNLYALGASFPRGATFEGNGKAVRRALAMVRELMVRKGASFDATPLTMKFSALLAAVARKS